ncbi:acyl-CoA dehydrogenase family protein [Caballeronia sp. LZ062]|uniref:acyl-CoA dehydrogenase family protein n=1 Tax=unclassified Caballeronia TaxID=2646786 RepID=UPI0028627086|nr:MULTISPECIES: acyl-CoA dehydrogenase family protein [unclassified Caballeronia]MDR5855353.1 acyl-CoA dehydrogenase family protein [Caballeronia sp. LZ050]MDR5870118.1 acyl-CoA dehydrogenase family protein [Caballeronia sp. LZ062]
MNFKLDSEQQLLQDSVRRFAEKECAFEARAALLKSGASEPAHWQAFADNGWLAAALPEAYSGLGGSVIDTVLIAQELGRALVVEPYLGCAVLAAQTLAAAATPAQLDHYVPQLADGSLRLALAYSEAQSRGFPEPVQTRATRTAEGYALRGTKTLVLGAPGANAYIVSAATDDDGPLTLFLVAASRPGVVCRPLRLHDGSWAAEIALEGVIVGEDAVLGAPGSGLAALRHGLSHGTAALCAELIGGMEKAIEMSAEYLKMRKQFGVPIGSFQALQHRMADMAAELEIARSMLFALLASLMHDNDAAARQRTVSQAKALIGRAAKFVCAQAIQLHGGIGMTEEYAVGHYYKRAVVADVLFGSSDRHEAACAAQLQHALLQGDIQA